MDKIVKVNLVLENCDVIEFKAEEIEYLEVGDVTHVFSGGSKNKLAPNILVNRFVICLNEKANREYKSIFGEYEGAKNIFDRLGHDVTQIEMIDEPGTSMSYLVNWTGDNPNFDENQFLVKNSKGWALVGANRQVYEKEIETFAAY